MVVLFVNMPAFYVCAIECSDPIECSDNLSVLRVNSFDSYQGDGAVSAGSERLILPSVLSS